MGALRFHSGLAKVFGGTRTGDYLRICPKAPGPNLAGVIARLRFDYGPHCAREQTAESSVMG